MTLKKHEIDAVTALYKRHESLRKVSDMLGYSPNTVKKYVQGRYAVNSPRIVRSLQTSDKRVIGVYVGLWMGDGTQYMDDGKYTVKICLDARNRLLISFVKWVFTELFSANTCVLINPGTNSCYVKTYSKFIYEFIDAYCVYSTQKAVSVRLRESVNAYSQSFVEGCVLGLMLSDGYLGRQTRFNVTSKRLAQDMHALLSYLGFRPYTYVQARENPLWNDLVHVVLNTDESKLLGRVLDSTLQKLVGDKTFFDLKYAYENDPARI